MWHLQPMSKRIVRAMGVTGADHALQLKSLEILKTWGEGLSALRLQMKYCRCYRNPEKFWAGSEQGKYEIVRLRAVRLLLVVLTCLTSLGCFL